VAVTGQRPPRANELIGRDANGYVLDRLIGEGGMGAVYGGYCAFAGQYGAIKVLLDEYTSHSELIERFEREAKATAKTRHPNIVRVLTAGRFREDGRMFIVMDYITGGSLEQLCRVVGPLPIDATVAIVLQVCDALDAVHEVGIVHRDVKTQNILLQEHQGRQYWAYLGDFGIAKLLDNRIAGNNFKTRTQSVIGTPGAMAPEQARGDKDIDARADVYSIGCVLYRMLTGRMPYEEENSYATMEKQARRVAFPRPRELRPEIPRVLEDLVLSCLEFERARRPASMRELGAPLSSVVADGKRMLRELAPRLRPGRPTGPSAPTLTGHLAFAYEADDPAPRPRILPLASLVVVSALVGAGSDALIHRTLDHKNHESIAATAGSATEPTSIVPPVRAATIERDAALAEVASAPHDAAAPLPDAPPAPKPPVVAVAAGSGSNAPSHNDHPRPHQENVAPATTGWLIVKVTPAVDVDVYVDDNLVGSAPVRKLLAVGKHHVKLSGSSKVEETDVTVNPGRESVIQRAW
jgi:serine/threonine protein kinase